MLFFPESIFVRNIPSWANYRTSLWRKLEYIVDFSNTETIKKCAELEKVDIQYDISELCFTVLRMAYKCCQIHEKETKIQKHDS